MMIDITEGSMNYLGNVLLLHFKGHYNLGDFGEVLRWVEKNYPSYEIDTIRVEQPTKFKGLYNPGSIYVVLQESE